MNRRKCIFWTVVISVLSIAGLMANGLSLNSIGARPFGMGGTGVSLDDDVSAIHWNPAGLAGQGTKLSLGLTDIMLPGNYKYDAANIDVDTEDNHYLNPGLFFNYGLDPKMSIGFAAYGIAGVGAEYDGSKMAGLSGGPTDASGTYPNLFYGKTYDWESRLGVMNISPAFAYKINEQFSVGLAGCIYWGTMTMDRGVSMIDNFNPYATEEDALLDSQYSDDLEGTGYGAALGVNYKPMDDLKIGFTFKTPVEVTFEGDGTVTMVSNDLNGDGVPEIDQKVEMDVERKIEWPMWIGLGASYKVMENLLVAFDLQYTNWSSIETLDTDMTISGQTGTEKTKMDWEDCVQIRLGGEYTINEMFKGRLGYYYDPAPAPDETANILFPSTTYHAVTGGFGFGMKNITADFGIEYLFGEERDLDETADHTNSPGTQSFDIFSYTLGIGYNF